MLQKYKFVKELGSGYNGLVDLYEKNNIKYVLKTQPLDKTEVAIVDGYLRLKTTRVSNELSFGRLVNMMPDNESKYFMKLISYDIVKDATFDVNRLTMPSQQTLDNERMQESMIVKIRKLPISEFYFLRCIYTYAGLTVEHYINEMMNNKQIDYKFTKLLADDLLKIVNIVNKYKWEIVDLHSANICFNGANIVLIDYGEMIDIIYEKREFALIDHYNCLGYWWTIMLLTNNDYRMKNLKPPTEEVNNDESDSEDFTQINAKTIIGNRNYKQIRQYLMDILDDKGKQYLVECENGKYDNFESIKLYANTILSILDEKTSDEFWTKYWDRFVPGIPHLIKKSDFVKILNGIKKHKQLVI